VPVVVIAEECRDFFKHEKTGVAAIIPCLPVIQESVKLSFLVTEKQDERIGQVAQHHHHGVQNK
jgi:hypothetical protein